MALPNDFPVPNYNKYNPLLCLFIVCYRIDSREDEINYILNCTHVWLVQANTEELQLCFYSNLEMFYLQQCNRSFVEGYQGSLQSNKKVPSWEKFQTSETPLVNLGTLTGQNFQWHLFIAFLDVLGVFGILSNIKSFSC